MTAPFKSFGSACDGGCEADGGQSVFIDKSRADDTYQATLRSNKSTSAAYGKQILTTSHSTISQRTIGVKLVHVSLNSVLASKMTLVKLVKTYPGLAERNDNPVRLRRGWCIASWGEVCIDRYVRDAVDANALGCPFDSKRLGHMDHSGLCRN